MFECFCRSSGCGGLDCGLDALDWISACGSELEHAQIMLLGLIGFHMAAKGDPTSSPARNCEAEQMVMLLGLPEVENWPKVFRIQSEVAGLLCFFSDFFVFVILVFVVCVFLLLLVFFFCVVLCFVCWGFLVFTLC